MANTVAIRRRIRSVSSTRQITKAMQLVAASKLRAATVAAAGAQRYRQRLDQVLAAALRDEDARQHPLTQLNADAPTRIVIIASDRGLAGAYHSRLEAELRRVVGAEQRAGRRVELTAVGQRAAAMALRIPGTDLIGRYPGPSVAPTMREMRPAVERLVAEYRQGVMGRLIVLTTLFYSPLRQGVKAVSVLPVSADAAATGNDAHASSGSSSKASLSREVGVEVPVLEPTPEAALDAAITSWLQAAMLDASVSAVASEHAMRMLAMQSATDNAGELVDRLTLQYNTARQAAITQELAEISGGVAALT